jgi:hypothetical protein
MVRHTWAIVGAMTVFGALTLGTAVSASIDERSRQVALERDATESVERIEEIAREVQYHVGRLEVIAKDLGVSRWSHYEHLESIKALVNRDLRAVIGRLTGIQKRLPGWKQDSIDRMMVAARDLAADTSSAFFSKNEKPTVPPLMNSEYTQLVSNLASHAAALVTTADAAHAYAVGHWKAAEAGLSVKP